MTGFLLRAHRAFRFAAFSSGFAVLIGSALFPSAGCQNDVSTETGDGTPKCEGGYLTAENLCVPKCDDSKCLDGNVCVENQCRLQCSNHAECFAGSQACTPANADSGASVQVCLENGHQVPTSGVGQGKPCPFGESECATQVCPNGLECDPMACNGDPASCVKNEAACADKEDCNIGTCSGDKSPCTVTTCEASECRALTCNTTGEGDTSAYCTQSDCMSDEQCGAGFYCGFVRDPHDVCGEKCASGKCSDGRTCTKDGDCQKGNNNFCGKTTDDCVDPASKPAGTTYEEGPLCMMRKACIRRDECAPCSSNLDCSGGSGDICINVGGTAEAPVMTCQHLCVDDSNCRKDQTCVSSGGSTCASTPNVFCTTSDDCPVDGDACEPRSVCIPRSGGCHAEGATDSKFCFACTNDFDCGGPDSSWGCSELGNGERACFDQSFSATCTKDSDCPQSPGGKYGSCLDEADGVNPSDSVYHRCYFPPQLDGGMLVGYSCFP